MTVEPVEQKTLSRNQYRKMIARYFLQEGLVEFYYCQRRPIMFVMATFRDKDGKHHQNFGWAKVAHPDSWSERDGLELALERAASNAAKDIVNKPLFGRPLKDKYGNRKIVPSVCGHWKEGDTLPFGIA